MVVLRENNAISLYGDMRDKDVNLLPVALNHGGGGHPYACGFRFKLSLKSKILTRILGKHYIPNEVWRIIEEVKVKL